MPLDPQALCQKLAQDLSQDEVVFPTCFNITLKVRELLRDPDVSIEKISTALVAEPVISSKLIRLANSAAMMPAGGNEVLDVHGAINRIGLETVKSVSISVAMEQMVRSKNMASYMDVSKNIWEHSTLTAALCRLLAKQSKRVKPDEAFFTGLVHDIGAFYLLFFLTQYAEFSLSREETLDVAANWHDGIGHALLAALGQNADGVLMAVQDHESTEPIKHLNTLDEVLRAANQIANIHTSWRPHENGAASLDELQLPLDADALQALMEQALVDVKDLHAVLAI